MATHRSTVCAVGATQPKGPPAMPAHQDDQSATAQYRQHLRDCADSMERQAHALRLAADLIDVQEVPNVAVAAQPVSSALGAISRAHAGLLDHTLLLPTGISQRVLAADLGMTQPTLNRRRAKARKTAALPED